MGKEIYIPPNAEYISGGVRKYFPADLEDFDIDLPKPKLKKVVKTSDFGADPRNKNNYQAFSDAIAKCKKINASHLEIEPGNYYIDTNEPLSFSGLSDLTIEGNNAELTFFIQREKENGIEIKNSSRIHFKNLIIDWDWKRAPIACVAKIVNVNPSERYFDLLMDIKNYSKQNICSIEPFDPKTFTIGSNEYSEEGEWFFEKQEWIDSNRLRIWTLKGVDRIINEKYMGNIYRARYYNYQHHALSYSDSGNITFENIRIYSFAGSGFVTIGGSHHIHFLNCRVTKRPGTDRVISVAGDLCMLKNTKGYIKIEGCEFGYGGDDAINIHPVNHLGFKKVGSDKIELSSPKLEWRTPFEVNDSLEFRHSDLSPTGFTTTIKSTKWFDDRTKCVLVLADNIPAHVSETSFIFDKRWASENYIIRNCRFHHNRARGILAQSSNGIIENCVFEDLQGPAIQVECGWDKRWSEGYGVQNLVIRNNFFKNCNVGKWKASYGAPIIYLGTYLPTGDSSFQIFDGIVISNNKFEDIAGVIISVNSTRRIMIQKNKFLTHRTGAKANSYSGSIKLKRSSDVYIDKNKWQKSESIRWRRPGLIFDSGNVNNVMFSNNFFNSP